MAYDLLEHNRKFHKFLLSKMGLRDYDHRRIEQFSRDSVVQIATLQFIVKEENREKFYSEIISSNRKQESFFSRIDNLVSKTHPYRKFIKLLQFKELVYPLSDLDNTDVGGHGYGIERGFKMLLLQYMEDISDRELECHGW